MTITEPKNDSSRAANIICPRCHTALPSKIIYCCACGERIKKQKNQEVRAPSLPVADLDTEKVATVSPSQHVEQQVTKLHSLVDTAYRKIVGILDLEGSSISNDRTLIQRLWLLARSLLHRFHTDSLLRNSIYIMGTGIATSILGYFFWVLATHIYSAYDVGLGAALISAMTLASILATLGVGFALTQTLPHRRAGYEWSLTLNAGLSIVTVASLLGGVIGLAVLPLFSQQFAIVENQIGYSVAFVGGVLLTTVSTVLDQVFVAERAAQHMLIRNAAVSALKIPLMVLLVVFLTEVGALAIFGSGVLAMAIMLIVGMLLLIPHLHRAYDFFAIRGIVGQARSMLSLLTGNYFINLGGLATGYLLPVLVSVRLSPADNAYYYTTTRVGDFILMGASAVAASLFAEASHKPDELWHKVRSSAMIISMILGPGILISFFGGYFILLIFGQSYAQHGSIVLKFEAIGSIPDAITSLYISVLRVHRRLRFAALINLGIGTISLIFTWILLPVLGIVGVPVGVLIGETAGSLLAAVDVIRVRSHQHKFSRSTLSKT
jgi:O-antigen/teichoic acid export membrane protein